MVVREPWASAIALLGKDVENRSRQIHLRGPLAIIAAKQVPPPHEYNRALEQIARILPSSLSYLSCVARETRHYGHLLCVVDLHGCTKESTSRWYMGHELYAWQVRRPLVLTPRPYRGHQGIVRVQLTADETRQLVSWKEAV